MATAIHEMNAETPLRHAAMAAVRGGATDVSASTAVFQAGQAVPSFIAKAATAAVAIGATALVVAGAIWTFNLIMPKAYRDYNRRASR